MEVTLIFQEEFVKGLLPLSENVAGGYLRTAMFEAQEIDLKNIVGSCLLDKLKATADEGGLDPSIYDTCIDKCLYFLAYRTLVRLIPKVSYKIASAGTYQNNDERMQPLTESMNNALVDEYTNSADYFAYELQGPLLREGLVPRGAHPAQRGPGLYGLRLRRRRGGALRTERRKRI